MFLMHHSTREKLVGYNPTLTIDGRTIDIDALEIRVSNSVPQSKIEERWIPPEAGQFTELTAEDEAWARPLRLGKVVSRDLGPVIYQFNDRLMREMMTPTPSLFMGQSYSNMPAGFSTGEMTVEKIMETARLFRMMG